LDSEIEKNETEQIEFKVELSPKQSFA